MHISPHHKWTGLSSASEEWGSLFIGKKLPHNVCTPIDLAEYAGRLSALRGPIEVSRIRVEIPLPGAHLESRVSLRGAI